jgi:hypothetical protein
VEDGKHDMPSCRCGGVKSCDGRHSHEVICTIAPDGKSSQGMNQDGTPLPGNLMPEKRSSHLLLVPWRLLYLSQRRLYWQGQGQRLTYRHYRDFEASLDARHYFRFLFCRNIGVKHESLSVCLYLKARRRESRVVVL